mmetsp:Transcript_41848/g.99266  ORF Transcript_41848/g.99266 Transcript_41848/m.99266 type:complete len:318 (+) Transcript_41848:1261-2214(+)
MAGAWDAHPRAGRRRSVGRRSGELRRRAPGPRHLRLGIHPSLAVFVGILRWPNPRLLPVWAVQRGCHSVRGVAALLILLAWAAVHSGWRFVVTMAFFGLHRARRRQRPAHLRAPFWRGLPRELQDMQVVHGLLITESAKNKERVLARVGSVGKTPAREVARHRQRFPVGLAVREPELLVGADAQQPAVAAVLPVDHDAAVEENPVPERRHDVASARPGRALRDAFLLHPASPPHVEDVHVREVVVVAVAAVDDKLVPQRRRGVAVPGPGGLALHLDLLPLPSVGVEEMHVVEVIRELCRAPLLVLRVQGPVAAKDDD